MIAERWKGHERQHGAAGEPDQEQQAETYARPTMKPG
jgi:hypothetical protein